MLNNVDNSSGVLVAIADGGYAISETIEVVENIAIDSTNDIFTSEYSLSPGDRISIVVDGEYVRTKIEESRIISELPFRYNTSLITESAIPSKVFFTGDLRTEITNISVNVDFINLSYSTIPDILLLSRRVTVGDNLIVVTEDNKVHNIDYMVPWLNNVSLSRIRYIRDHINGSTSNTGNHWVEIQALEVDTGENRALSSVGATISGSVPESEQYPYSRIIDGSTDSSIYAAASISEHAYITIDLGAVYDIETLKVWHYNLDGRTYYETKTEVSIDGVEWFSMYDSSVSGLYIEEGSGFIIPVINGPRFTGSTMNIASVTNSEVPRRVYCARSEMHINNTQIKDDTIKYIPSDDGMYLSALIKKENTVLMLEDMQTTIKFVSKGDIVKSVKHLVSALINDRHYPPSISMLSTSDTSASQSIIFTMN